MPRYSTRPPPDRRHAHRLHRAPTLNRTRPQRHGLNRGPDPRRTLAAPNRSSCCHGKVNRQPWYRPFISTSILGSSSLTTSKASSGSLEAFESPFPLAAMPLLKYRNSYASNVSPWRCSLRFTRIPPTIACPFFTNSNNCCPFPLVFLSLKGRSHTARPEDVSINITKMACLI